MAKATKGRRQRTEVQAARPSREFKDLPVEKLLLDPENPRLASFFEEEAEPTQPDLLRLLWDEMAVDELVLSIAANGFFREEPLFVIPDGKGKYVVIEGNRRLAAVKVLLNDDVRERLRIEGMPTVSGPRKESLRTLPVSVYSNREELWAFLSFRHINSAKAWDAYSKAKYIAHVHEDYGIPLSEIAARIGDRHETVQRMYRGFRVLQQAETNGVYSVKDSYRSRFAFSHLYTALNYPDYQEFLGITEKTLNRPNPVPKSHIDELGELLTWLYGSKDANTPPVVTKQNPDLSKLRKVLSVGSALAALRRGYSLDKCYNMGVGDTHVFREALTAAKAELQQAKSTVATGYKGELDALRIADDIVDLGVSLQEEMTNRAKRTGR